MSIPTTEARAQLRARISEAVSQTNALFSRMELEPIYGNALEAQIVVHILSFLNGNELSAEKLAAMSNQKLAEQLEKDKKRIEKDSQRDKRHKRFSAPVDEKEKKIKSSLNAFAELVIQTLTMSYSTSTEE